MGKRKGERILITKMNSPSLKLQVFLYKPLNSSVLEPASHHPRPLNNLNKLFSITYGESK